MQIAELSMAVGELPIPEAKARLEGYPPVAEAGPVGAPVATPGLALDAALEVAVGAALDAALDAALEVALDAAPVPVPAAGRWGSVASMYEAPLEPASARTAATAIHFEARPLPSPK